MKKFIESLIILFSVLFIFSACKKENVERTVVGYWKGKYLGNPNTDWSWLVRADNTLRVYIGTDSATANKFNGTYVATDSSITATYAIGGGFNTVVKARLNSGFTHMEGSDFFGYNYYLDK